MATTTPNYGLTKPASTDYYNIAVQNENMDKVDAALSDKIGTAQFNAHKAETEEELALKATQTGLDAANAEIALKAAVSYVDSRIGEIGNTKTFKGACLYAELPVSGMVVDDYWYVTDQETNYCYNGSSWVDIGNGINLGNGAVKKENMDTEIFDALVSYYPLELTLSPGYINRYNGTYSPISSYKSTQYIPVLAGEKFKITAVRDSSSGVDCIIARYDESQDFLNYVATSPMSDYMYTIPANGYIRICSYQSDPIVKKEIVDTREQINTIKSEINKIDTDISVLSSVGHFADVQGTYGNTRVNPLDKSINGPEYNNISLQTQVTAGELVYVKAKIFSIYECVLSLLSGGIVVQTYLTGTGVVEEKSITITIPSGIDSIIAVARNAPPLVQKYVPYSTNDIYSRTKSYWANKKIVWFGTSIPAGNSTAGNYPTMVGQILGAAVYNEALGTSMARCGSWERVQEGDPLGIHSAHWQIATRAMSQTVAEKQDIIDHWADIWGGLSSDPRKLYQAPDTLSSDEQARILGSSYETKLVSKYLGVDSKRSALYVFDHGWNDAAFPDDWTEIPEDPYDRHYYIGAMNFLIRAILQDNPKARIALIGHYENGRKPALCEAQEILANYWNIPLLKLWEKTGFSTIEITSGGTTKSIIEWYMPDGLHPHSDTTGATNRLYAEIIAAWLDTVR